MARGADETFSGYLSKIIQEIALAKLSVDADQPFLAELEQMVLGRMRASQPTGATEAGPISQGMSPVPVTPIEPLSRGPAPAPDMAGGIEELSRVLAGS